MSLQEPKKIPAKDAVSPEKTKIADLNEKAEKFAKRVTKKKLKIGLR